MEKFKEIEIDGVVSKTDKSMIDEHAFWLEFVSWLESKGMAFGGGINGCVEETESKKKFEVSVTQKYVSSYTGLVTVEAESVTEASLIVNNMSYLNLKSLYEGLQTSSPEDAVSNVRRITERIITTVEEVSSVKTKL